jgi:hypothetical protein
MKFVATILLIITCASPLIAQEKNRKEQSKEWFAQLENGHLLVQLFNRDRTKQHIEAELGPNAVARYEADQMEKRKRLMKAFETHFTFCPVLFFYSNDASHLKNKDFDRVTFYNSQHQVIPAEQVNISSFLIGEVSRVESDSITYVSADGTTKKRPSYAFSAFVFRDNQFRQLRKPFPFYVRTMQGTPILQRKENGLVKAIQNKLVRFNKKK